MAKRLTYMFYNLRVGRPLATVTRELNALLGDKPAVLGLVEAEGYSLPKIAGYKLIRDRSKPGRANVAAYVREDLQLDRVRWRDMHETWHRTEHPGVHPPRSWLSFFIDGIQVVVGHQPPKFTNNTVKAQQEGINYLVWRTAPWTRRTWRLMPRWVKRAEKARGRVIMADFNRGPQEDGPGPKLLAQKINGHVHGKHIDCAVVRMLNVSTLEDFSYVNGVHLGTDHPWGALRFSAF